MHLSQVDGTALVAGSRHPFNLSGFKKQGFLLFQLWFQTYIKKVVVFSLGRYPVAVITGL